MSEEVAMAIAAAAELAPLPPLGEPLKHDWTRFRDDGTGKIVMWHIKSGYLISGREIAALELQARHIDRFLDELSTFHWRVFFDPGAVGVAGLHAYTATHQEHAAISAPTIERLALAAWRSRLYEDDAPNMPDDVVEALYLAGWRWGGLAWARGFERIDEDADLDELRYTLGLETAPARPAQQQPPASTPPGLLPDGYADAQKRAKGLGLYLDMNVKGEFSLTHEATGRAELAAGVTDFAVVLARLASRAAWVGEAPAAAAPTTLGELMKALLEGFGDGRLDDARAAWRTIGLALWPAPPPARPRPPRSADVSAQVAYTTALEKYASALEQQLTGQGQ